MKEICISEKEAGIRLDKYLRKLLPAAGSSFLYKMLRKKNIVLCGAKASGQEILKAGDSIKIFFSDETYAKMSGSGEADDVRLERGRRAYGELKGIDILYENEDVLFADKPAGVLTQSDEGGELSLNDWLTGYVLEKNGSIEPKQMPSVMNRLDRNTSGIVMCGLNYAGSRFLSDTIRGGGLKKLYLALAEGRLEGEGELRGFLIKDKVNNKVSISDGGEGSPVVTRYRALELRDGYTLLEVELESGKSHQIRAHLAHIGHPLAGDIKYGGHPYKGKSMQYLHAYKLIFPVSENDEAGMSGRVIESRCTF